MRFGIPLLDGRVAPRCTFADSVLVVEVRARRIREERVVPMGGSTWADLAEALADQNVDTLVCGGIAPGTRESIQARDVDVVENVTGTSREILDALCTGQIRSGFGYGGPQDSPPAPGAGPEKPAKEMDAESWVRAREADSPSDCMDCRNRVCLQGRPCPHLALDVPPPLDDETLRVLESTWDVALEEERTLCRLAEVVYFALGIGCRRVGVAFCEELREPASILIQVLKRFVKVIPVGCKAGASSLPKARAGTQTSQTPRGSCETGLCNPLAMAQVLNAGETDLNIVVGLCVGADCVFNRESDAPVTTIFVKDKSLANNPIGAVYSHYYLEDI